MRLAIMQPYLFPYLGYFQLMSAVDAFVVYDNIEYTKKGWINRNRILLNGKDMLFSVPLKKDSDFLPVDKRFLADDAKKEINKILGQIRSGYAKAPFFKSVFPLVEKAFLLEEKNLFTYVLNSMTIVRDYLGIKTPLIVASTLEADHQLKGKDKVIALCKAVGADTYINPIGGMELYEKEEFINNGIQLEFHRMNGIEYKQDGVHPFQSSLSIIDVMMFNSQEVIANDLLKEFTLN